MSQPTTNQAEVLRILSEALERLQPWMEEGLEPLLQAVVDHARTLVNAAFAGIIITEPKNPSTIRYFKVSGWDGKPVEFPKGHGMYFVPVKTGDSLHVDSISGHPLSVGMPTGHPPVEALLTIPLKYHGQAIGCIFFGQPPKTGSFTKSDEDMMNGFASLCSIFISWCDQQNENCFRILTEERQRIAEELHDSLSQTLFAVVREIDRLERLTVAEKSELQARTARLRELTEQCQSELRAILFRLMDDEARPNVTALTHLVQEFERISGISTKLITHGDGDFSRLSLPIRQTILKIVAESLTNVFRHANSPVAIVHLLVETDAATITVQDAGDGISDEALRLITHPTGHFGLHSIARSVAVLNGQLDIFRNEDGGTTVRCTFPIR
ncbi:GAF domain-containing sensor histidine kinase [Alicyclobacillus shizuokensis]|uniref:GAF domain-containing sensor histidine kinase n=1 Tax=Alicyclobacillus shizuokensis TaxID=392014 RepID=UPI0008374B14|nr:GAF domain-containing protein [Alicyclobacillus shizuokensis]